MTLHTSTPSPIADVSDVVEEPLDDFFKTGGTLLPDDRSYITRKADKQLYEALKAGEFCYVLTSRQMGKSSLMVRTAVRLRAEGTRVVSLDLTAFGQNITAEQWYDGMRDRIGHQLNLAREIDAYWERAASIGPLQRLMQVISEIALPRMNAPLVIFIDEIDFARSLPFSTDEFFAAIRECYNRRTEQPVMRNLTFCLLGVASPSDLIRDTRTTPFNVGHRIELTDFTAAEATPLAQGLRHQPKVAAKLLDRILYWTNGHPYLTQRLCCAIANDPDAEAESAVDRHGQELFLCSRARTSDDNLIFVRERMLRSEVDLVGLLELYRKVLRGEQVPYEEGNPLAGVLRLSGIVQVIDGLLRIRNRIYHRVFDRSWIEGNLPDQERRRQRAAYVRGVMRTGALAAVIVAAMTALVGYVQHQSAQLKGQSAQLSATLADKSAALASERTAKARADEATSLVQKTLENARHQESLARRALGKGQLVESLIHEGDALGVGGRWGDSKARYLDAYKLAQELPDADAVEKYTFQADLGLSSANAVSPPNLLTLTGHSSGVLCTAISSDGRRAASGAWDGRIILWDLPTGVAIRSYDGHELAVRSVAFSADSQTLFSASDDGTVRVWQVAGKVAPKVFHVLPPAVQRPSKFDALWAMPRCTADFSGDRDTFLVGTDQGDVWLYRLSDGTRIRKIRGGSGSPVVKVRFSPAAPIALVAVNDDTSDAPTEVWDVTAPGSTPLLVLKGHHRHVWDAAFSSDGTQIVTAGYDNTVKVWNAKTGAKLRVLRGHTAGVRAVAISSDSRFILSGGEDRTVRLWDLKSEQPREIRQFTGHSNFVRCVGFSEEGNLALTGGDDQSLQLWDLRNEAEAPVIRSAAAPNGLSFATDRPVVLFGQPFPRRSEPGRCVLWDIPTGNQLFDGQVEIAERRGDEISVRRISDGGILGTFIDRSGVQPDGRMTAEWDKENFVVFEGVGGRVRSVAPHDSLVRHIEFSHDGMQAVSVSNDKTVRVWDVRTGVQLRKLTGHSNIVLDAFFSPDGRFLLSGGCDAIVKLWDLETERELRSFPRHHPDLRLDISDYDVVQRVAISADGNTIAAQYGNWDTEFWDLSRPQAYRKSIPAVADARRVIERNPDDAAALAEMARWYEFRGIWQWAAELFSRARAGGAKVASLDLARCYWRAARPSEAQREFEQALLEHEAPADYLKACIDAVRNSAKAPAAGSLEAATRQIAANPVPANSPQLWEILGQGSANDGIAVLADLAFRRMYTRADAVTRRLPSAAAATQPSRERTELISQALRYAASGTEFQRPVALSLLVIASPNDAAKAAYDTWADPRWPVTQRADALRVLMVTQKDEAARRLAVTALASKDAMIRKVALLRLSLSPLYVRQLGCGIYLRPDRWDWRPVPYGEGKAAVYTAPEGLTVDVVRPLLKDPDEEAAALAGYLASLLGERQGVDAVLRYWRKQDGSSPSWRVLVSRTVAAVGDDTLTPILADIYKAYASDDNEDSSEIRRFYWTIRNIKGANALRLRREIRADVGMSQLW